MFYESWACFSFLSRRKHSSIVIKHWCVERHATNRSLFTTKQVSQQTLFHYRHTHTSKWDIIPFHLNMQHSFSICRDAGPRRINGKCTLIKFYTSKHVEWSMKYLRNDGAKSSWNCIVIHFVLYCILQQWCLKTKHFEFLFAVAISFCSRVSSFVFHSFVCLHKGIPAFHVMGFSLARFWNAEQR